MLASRMSASRGIAPLANIPDGECRDGPPELVVGGEYPVVPMPVEGKGWPGAVSQQVFQTLAIARHVAVDEYGARDERR
jgi:hypothetical protein